MIDRLVVPKGLGDAIYLRAIVIHCLRRGSDVAVMSRWRDLFSDLPVDVFPRAPTEEGFLPCGFSLRHKLTGVFGHLAGKSQFDLFCHRAGIAEPISFQINWVVKNQALVDTVLRGAAGRPVLLFQPRKIRNALIPGREAFDAWIRSHRGHYRVRLGQSYYVRDENADCCELDLFGKTAITDVFDVATVADLFFGDLCYLGVLADSMSKSMVVMVERGDFAGGWSHVTVERLFRNSHLASLITD